MPPKMPSDDFLAGLYETMRGRAAGLAPHFQPGYGATELDGDDLETVWNRRAMPIEKEWELWRQGRTPETAHLPMLSPEHIGLLVFPDREKLAKSGGRVEPHEFISWTNAMAKRMAAKRDAQAAMNLAPSEPMDGGY